MGVAINCRGKAEKRVVRRKEESKQRLKLNRFLFMRKRKEKNKWHPGKRQKCTVNGQKNKESDTV